MNIYIGYDAHKRYSVFAAMNEKGQTRSTTRINHGRILFRHFLHTLPPESPIAVETVGSWYWMIDEMEKAGHNPILVHAGKAKLMMGQIDKSLRVCINGIYQRNRGAKVER